MRWLALLITSFLVTSCATKTNSQASVTESLKNANQYLSLAENAQQPDKSRYLLKAGQVLVEKNKYLRAQEAFTFLNPGYLNAVEKEDYYLFYGIALQRLNQPASALSFFRRIEQPNQHDIDWQILYQQSLADAYLSDGNFFESASIRIRLEDILFDNEAITQNHELIWQSLRQINPQFLRVYQDNTVNPILQGWLELVSITRNEQESPQKLLAAINLWQQRFPSHPASLQLPADLSRVTSAKTYEPKKVAVLLPLSGSIGNSGKMVRDGLLAAHYQASFADQTPQLSFYDTAKSVSVLTTYQQAIDDGAEFIVGPLTKEALTQIVEQDVLQAPQLALNRIDQSNLFHPELFQFGLPIEDEAIQIAELAIKQKHQTAIVMAPNNAQGERIIDAFRNSFESAGGQIAEIQRFDDPKQIKQVVKQLLNIDRSESRQSMLRQILGEPFEFEQRRRKDADMVFVAASPTDARRIKPFLNFYYAQDLPVYAVSRINDGAVDKRLNNDLNGILFTDSPLLISDEPNIKILREQVTQALPATRSPYGRLFALGYDAYKILPSLSIMQAFGDYRQTGLSGELFVDQSQNVKRLLSIAQFQKGLAKPIKVASEKANNE